jgi:hypothetical protein
MCSLLQSLLKDGNDQGTAENAFGPYLDNEYGRKIFVPYGTCLWPENIQKIPFFFARQWGPLPRPM